MKKSDVACPCGSGERLRACCGPYHAGREPEDVERLVRTRFAAFACGDGAYLWRTTHPDHPLRARPEAEVVRELSAARRSLRYRELILHASETDVERGRARVLFTARVFSKGRDRSFVELSDFAFLEGGWRYLDGLSVPRERLAEPPTTIEAFEATLAG